MEKEKGITPPWDEGDVSPKDGIVLAKIIATRQGITERDVIETLELWNRIKEIEPKEYLALAVLHRMI